MESTELRIGNYVNGGYDDIEVHEISREKVNDGILDHALVNVKGIPITEDWLTKLGFVEMEDTVPEGYSMFKPPFEDGRVYFKEGNNRYNWAVYEGLAIDDQIEIASFEYIHQLQNLYFAISGGKELTL